jgi:hypothetical protein
MTPLPLAIAAALLLPGAALAQSGGGAVPPYVPPERAAPPVRDQPGDSDPYTRAARPERNHEAQVAAFGPAYRAHGSPRLAVYWNRQLSEALTQWYSESRLVRTDSTEGGVSGDLNLQQQGGRQSVLEYQMRLPDAVGQRPQLNENWEWRFQDGFIEPFLAAGARLVDRETIIRLTAIGQRGIDQPVIEAKALSGMADLLIEVLVAPQGQSSTGYELRARIIDVRDGRILGYVNSRRLKSWQRSPQYYASEHGIDLPDEDDEGFGPERTDKRYRATEHGFVRQRKPPKVEEIGQSLAEAVMDSLLAHWGAGTGPARIPPGGEPTPTRGTGPDGRSTIGPGQPLPPPARGN